MFVVEDGTGLPNANSYVDLVYADAYFARKNLKDWWDNLSQDAKQNELINGTEYIDNKFGATLKGRPLKDDQALEYPRSGLTDRYGRPITGVPDDVKAAACQYGYLSSQGTLHQGSTSIKDKVKSKTVKVGPITTSTSYVDGQREYTSTYLDHPQVDTLIYPHTSFGGKYHGGKVIRA